MKAIIFGATGMVGKGVLLECLDHPEVHTVLSVGRNKVDIEDSTLIQIEHADFTDFSPLEEDFQGYDACFYCMGVSSAGMSEDKYKHLTYDFAMAAAKELVQINPHMTFVYVSGQGTDSSEKGRIMWARVKGKLENDLLSLGFNRAVMFRPGVIVPKRGIKSRTALYQRMYDLFGWLFRLLESSFPNSITDTTKLGKAMINAHLKMTKLTIAGPKEINELAEM